MSLTTIAASWVIVVGATNAERSESIDAVDDPNPIRLWVDAGTEVPLQVGGRLELEAWARLRLWSSLGVLPTPYVEVIDAFARAAGGYNDETGELVVSSLERSLIWRLHAGWRPFEDAGFTIDFGYTLATLGGDAGSSELISAALGRQVQTPIENTFNLDSTVHLLGVELGWRWPLPAGFSLRASVGFAGTVAASTRATPVNATPIAESLGRDLANYLDGVFTSYVHVPYVGVGIGYGLHELF